MTDRDQRRLERLHVIAKDDLTLLALYMVMVCVKDIGNWVIEHCLHETGHFLLCEITSEYHNWPIKLWLEFISYTDKHRRN